MPSIQETIRAVLGADGTVTALVGDRIYPGQVPDDEAESPWLYYSLPDSTPNDELDGTDFRAQVEFHALALDYATAKAILDAVYGALHTYSGGQIRRAFWAGTSEEVIDDGYHHVARYDVGGTLANLAASGTAVGRILTGSDTITLTVAGHTLTLDASGLTVTGFVAADGYFGSGADLSGVAVLASDNVFDGDQTVNGTLAATSLAGAGPGITGMSASNLSAGTLADARLSSNVPLKNAPNTFTAAQTFTLPALPNNTPQTAYTVVFDNGKLAFRVRANYDPTGSGSFSYFDIYNPRNGVLFGSFGFQDGIAAIYFSADLYSAGRLRCEGGVVVGSFATSFFSGPLQSTANVPLDLVGQAGFSVRMKGGTSGTTGVEVDKDGHLGLLGASPVARPTVTGSRGGNAALAGLLAALAQLGAITDSTTA